MRCQAFSAGQIQVWAPLQNMIITKNRTQGWERGGGVQISALVFHLLKWRQGPVWKKQACQQESVRAKCRVTGWPVFMPQQLNARSSVGFLCIPRSLSSCGVSDRICAAHVIPPSSSSQSSGAIIQTGNPHCGRIWQECSHKKKYMSTFLLVRVGLLYRPLEHKDCKIKRRTERTFSSKQKKTKKNQKLMYHTPEMLPADQQ